MSIQHAKIFLSQVHTDPEFRKLCNVIGSKEGIYDMLKGIKMDFKEDEFEDAINLMLLNCQTYEEADVVKQLELWYNLM